MIYVEDQLVKVNGVVLPDWTPPATPALWAVTSDPADEWPEWSQPLGAHDAYQKGDKVTHNGKHWISTADANVWEPGVYGWTEELAEKAIQETAEGPEEAPGLKEPALLHGPLSSFGGGQCK